MRALHQNTHSQSRKSTAHAGLFALVLYLAAAPLGLSGCTAHLAPDYDQSIVDGLTDANTKTMTLFASTSSGTTASTFPAREPTYNAIIGQFDALRLEIVARPTPPPPFFLAPAAGGKPTDSSSNAPSAASLGTIVQTLTRMKTSDQAGPVPPDVVAVFKNSYEVSFEQAFTYEMALKR